MAAGPDARCVREEIEVLRKDLFRAIEVNGGDLTSEEVLAFSKRLDEAIVLFQLRAPVVKGTCRACVVLSRRKARACAG